MSIALVETAQRLECNERTLRRYIGDGVLRGVRGKRREVRLPFAEEEYIRRHWEIVSGLRRALRTEPSVRLAVLYGSTAAGDDRRDSDIDLLIDCSNDDLQELARLRRRLQAHVERPLHLVLLADAKGSALLLSDVLAEGRVLVNRDGTWERLGDQRHELERLASAEEQATQAAAQSGIEEARHRIAAR